MNPARRPLADAEMKKEEIRMKKRIGRIWSMTLAVIMALSLFTFAPVSAGATSYTDDNEISYTGSVDVVTALGIMSGYPDGRFGPTYTLSRGAATKIICTMLLGGAAAENLPKENSGFLDVPDGSDFAGYIAYCRQRGIISGYGSEYFDPLGTLSGTAFLKMLLNALGYRNIESATDEYFSYLVQNAARQSKLLENISEEVSGSPITREVVANLIVNALQADMVAANNWNTGKVYYRYWDNSEVSPSENNISSKKDGSAHNANVIQFAELYFPGLVRSFDNNIVIWNLYGVEIARYVAGTWTIDTTPVANPTVTLTPTPIPDDVNINDLIPAGTVLSGPTPLPTVVPEYSVPVTPTPTPYAPA